MRRAAWSFCDGCLRMEYFTADFHPSRRSRGRNVAACVTAPLSRPDCCTIITTRLDKHLLYLIAASLSLTLLAHGCKCQTIPRRRKLTTVVRSNRRDCSTVGNRDAIFRPLECSSVLHTRDVTQRSLSRQISSSPRFTAR